MTPNFPGAQQNKQSKAARSFRFHVSLDAVVWGIGAFLATSSAVFGQQQPPPLAENALQIVAAGVETSEDAPFAAQTYRYLPGDYVYFQFQVSGYGVQTKEGSETRKMSLTYEATPLDAKGIALTPPMTGFVKEELSSEDKNWTPKRRDSFLLPSFVAAGEYRVHLSVTDLIANKTTQRDLPFHIGGTVVIPTDSLSVQDFQFLRKEDDTQGLDVPAFSPGDAVYVRFLLTGFHLGNGNEYHLSYGLTVARPDGKVYLSQPNAAELGDKSFYPVAFVPGNLSITTNRTSARGQYTVLVTVRDLQGDQTYQVKRAFSIE